jgi:hypothetical protein
MGVTRSGCQRGATYWLRMLLDVAPIPSKKIRTGS